MACASPLPEVLELGLAGLGFAVDDPAGEPIARAAQRDLVQLTVQVHGGEDLEHALVHAQPAQRLDHRGAELVVEGDGLPLGALAVLALGPPPLSRLLLGLDDLGRAGRLTVVLLALALEFALAPLLSPMGLQLGLDVVGRQLRRDVLTDDQRLKATLALVRGPQPGRFLDRLAPEVDGDPVDVDLQRPTQRREVPVGLLGQRELRDRVGATGLIHAGRQLGRVAVVLGTHRADRVGAHLRHCSGSSHGFVCLPTRAAATTGSCGWILASATSALSARSGTVPSAIGPCSSAGSSRIDSRSRMRASGLRTFSATPLRVRPASMSRW